jgi:hypothetical protein
LLDNTGVRLAIEFAWLITDGGELAFGPDALGVSDHDAAGEIHRRRMKFLSDGNGESGVVTWSMGESTNEEIRGRGVCVDLDEPLLWEKVFLHA